MNENNVKAHLIFTDIEAKIPIMFWDPLEFVMAICFFGFGMITDLWIFGLGAGIAVLFGARYLKRGAKRGAVQHLLWSIGLQMDSCLTKKFKPAWVNDFNQ